MRTFEGGVPMSRGQEMKKDMEEADKIRCFIEAERVTAAQIDEAYQRFAGIWDGKEDATPAVGELRSMMEKSGLTYTRLARFIGERRDYEAALDKLPALIDELQVTPHEKDVLRSVISEWRLGTLSFFDAKTGELLTETVIPTMPLEDAEHLRHDIAVRLYVHLLEYKNKKIEIQFIEE